MGSDDELLLAGSASVLLKFADGSQASISYVSDASPSTPKERIEVMGRGRSASILDFRIVVLDSSSKKQLRGQDKGHMEQAKRFRRAITEGETRLAPAFIESSRTTLLAVDSAKRARRLS